MGESYITSAFRARKHTYPENLRLHLRRTLSWLDKAEQSYNDKDVQFISLWIAFNTIYAKELSVQSADRINFVDFAHKICRLDDQKAVIYSGLADLFAKYLGDARQSLCFSAILGLSK